jgi:hypothetical protein
MCTLGAAGQLQQHHSLPYSHRGKRESRRLVLELTPRATCTWRGGHTVVCIMRIHEALPTNLFTKYML